MDVKAFGRRAKYGVRNLISHVPAIYLPLADMKKRDKDGATIVTRDTELVMDAFPRSGSTFAVTAFRLAQDRQVNLAHHFHAPAQLIQGVRLGKPVLLIVRQPKDAVCSFVLREPQMTVQFALGAWNNFHRRVLPYASGFVVASFERVTADFGAVIDQVNARFGTAFGRFDHTDANVQNCFRLIEQRSAMRFGGGVVQEAGVARPSGMRKLQKGALEEKWQALSPRILQQSADLYTELLGLEQRNT